jgi:hypothetical protein
MAEKNGNNVKLEGQIYEGHGDKTQPAGCESPATFIPLSKEPVSTNQKTDLGRTGRIGQ